MGKIKNQDKIEELEKGNKLDSSWETKKKWRFLRFPVSGRSEACQGMGGWL